MGIPFKFHAENIHCNIQNFIFYLTYSLVEREALRKMLHFNMASPKFLSLSLVTLLRPWLRRLAMISAACGLQTSSKFSGQEFEDIHANIGSLEAPM